LQNQKLKFLCILKAEMKEAAKVLEFEKAARLRDQIKALTDLKLELGG